MKNAPLSEARNKATGAFQLGGSFASAQTGRALPTSVVLKTATDAKRQHAAIGKLVKMCRASSVVTNASRGITAEVRRDRDRGHE